MDPPGGANRWDQQLKVPTRGSNKGTDRVPLQSTSQPVANTRQQDNIHFLAREHARKVHEIIQQVGKP